MSSEYHLILIVNKNAASGKSSGSVEKVTGLLERRNIPYDIYYTSGRDETIDLVNDITSFNDRDDGSFEAVHIVAFGGDGTLNSVLTGIKCFEKTRLSCIKTGSGNDFARNMKLPSDPEEAMVHILDHPEEIKLDYGELIYRTDNNAPAESGRFLISSGIGYDADICADAEESSLKQLLNRIRLGRLVYLLTGIKQMFTRKGCRAVIKTDDHSVHIKRLCFCVGMIHKFEGGGVPFCPDADPCDGQLDVCLVKMMPPLKMMIALIAVYLKGHRFFNEVRLYRCRKLEVITENRQWFHMDGDTPERVTRLSLEVKNGLHFIR